MVLAHLAVTKQFTALSSVLIEPPRIRDHPFRTPGAIEWKLWPHSLAEFAKLPFQP